jgi:hypothetical protein
MAGVLLAIAVVAGSTRAFGQEATGYEPLSLPSDWKEFREKVDGVERVEYIYGDRAIGLLRIKHLDVSASDSVEAVVERELNGPIRFLPDYAFLKKEPFGGGNHAGVMVEFNFTKAKKPALARYYYLKANDTTVWVLQFTGARASLKPIRNVTDQMARGFKAQ